ncbi:MAG: dicarboxylate transporter subunit DctP [Bradyrhizobium sp.]|nr:dicarboxylate transporter subunit DctP [Bradyrhizobium sp.]
MAVLNRRSFLQTAAAVTATGFGVRRASAADFNLKLGSSMPSSIISVGYLKKAAEKINSETNGKVDLKIFPDSQLGSDADMLSQLRSGALSMLSGTTGSLGTLVPAASLSTVGFAFDTYDQVWKAMDGELGTHIRSELDKVGIVYLNVFDSGFRQITTSSVLVKSVDQMSGLKIRVPTSPIYASMFRAMGCSPTTINFGEVYSALQTKLVDGQENPLSLIQSAKIYEVQKHCAMSNHAWDGPLMCINKAAWNKMPKDIQEVITRVFKETAIEQRAAMAAQGDQIKADLTKAGLAFNTPDTESFRKKLAEGGFYSEMKKILGANNWAVLEKVSNIRT